MTTIFLTAAWLRILLPGMQTLDISSLVNTGQMFANANILIGAVAGVVLVAVGFNLAKLVIRFVLNIFNGLSI